MPRRIIIDTDPGVDDAVAILLALASPELEVVGLVAVAGNLPLAVTELNARALVELAGRPDIPVFAGCPRPMSRTPVTAEHVHGDGGLGGLVLPAPAMPPRPQHGVDFLIQTLRQAAPNSVTLCALGPLTNIATALVMAPDIAAGIAEIVLMGGAARLPGNITPAADPRLAKARTLVGQQKILEAVKLYDQVLKDDPKQPEALTYRGWLVRLAGLPDDGLKYIDRAVAADPTYPDARVFRGIIELRDKNRPAAAVTDFCAFMANHPDPQMASLVQQPLDEALKATGRTAC